MSQDHATELQAGGERETLTKKKKNGTKIFILYFAHFSLKYSITLNFSANKIFEQEYENEQSFLNVGNWFCL